MIPHPSLATPIDFYSIPVRPVRRDRVLRMFKRTVQSLGIHPPISYVNKATGKMSFGWDIERTESDLLESQANEAAVKTMLPALENGEWFDMGAAPYELISDAGNDAQAFFEADLMRLPYPQCIFRIRINNHIMFQDVPLKDCAQELVVVCEERDTDQWYGIRCVSAIFFDPNANRAFYGPFLACTRDKLTGDVDLTSPLEKTVPVFKTILGCWLVLNTDGVTNRRVIPSEKLNRARAKNNKPPLDTVTYVDSASYVTAIRSTRRAERFELQGDPRASPHPHLRRAHIRNLASGKKIGVRACIIRASSLAEMHRRSHYEMKPT